MWIRVLITPLSPLRNPHSILYKHPPRKKGVLPQDWILAPGSLQTPSVTRGSSWCLSVPPKSHLQITRLAGICKVLSSCERMQNHLFKTSEAVV